MRRRFCFLPGNLHLDLNRDNFTSVSFDEDLTRIAFTLENSSGSPHATAITVAHPKGGTFKLGNGERTQKVELPASKPSVLTIPVGEAKAQVWRLEYL